jgi:general secretion pathway protein N
VLVAVVAALPALAWAEGAAFEVAVAGNRADPLGGGDRPRVLLDAPDATAPAPARIGNPLWAVPLRSLREARERPIFLPARRRPPPAVAATVPPKPPPPPPAPVAAVKEPPPLSFVGAIMGTADQIAVFRNETTKEFVRMRVGEGHGSWVLRELSRTEAVFESQNETAVVGTLRAGGARIRPSQPPSAKPLPLAKPLPPAKPAEAQPVQAKPQDLKPQDAKRQDPQPQGAALPSPPAKPPKPAKNAEPVDDGRPIWARRRPADDAPAPPVATKPPPKVEAPPVIGFE